MLVAVFRLPEFSLDRIKEGQHATLDLKYPNNMGAFGIWN